MNEVDDLAPLELKEPVVLLDQHTHLAVNVLKYYGPLYNGVLMTNRDCDRESAARGIGMDKADLVSFGCRFWLNLICRNAFSETQPLINLVKRPFKSKELRDILATPSWRL